jgi:type I restriction enzyme S subunit
MASRHGRSYFEITAKRTTNLASTNSTTLGAFPINLPSAAEQQVILEVVAIETSTLDVAVKQAEREIELLREYRTRLIAGVVTGKLDVRAAAARLPDDGDDGDTDADELPESEEVIDDAELDAEPEEVDA